MYTGGGWGHPDVARPGVSCALYTGEGWVILTWPAQGCPSRLLHRLHSLLSFCVVMEGVMLCPWSPRIPCGAGVEMREEGYPVGNGIRSSGPGQCPHTPHQGFRSVLSQ